MTYQPEHCRANKYLPPICIGTPAIAATIVLRRLAGAFGSFFFVSHLAVVTPVPPRRTAGLQASLLESPPLTGCSSLFSHSHLPSLISHLSPGTSGPAEVTLHPYAHPKPVSPLSTIIIAYYIPTYLLPCNAPGAPLILPLV